MTRPRNGFTLIELLVVIAIIAALLSVVIFSLRGVRSSATRAESLSALRQIGQGYSSYTGEHRQQLMPGYLDQAALAQLSITATLAEGTALDQICDGGRCAAGSYVWRLAPYLDNNWLTFFQDMTDEGAISELQADFAEALYGPTASAMVAFAGGISERPTYGLNSIFLGGDTVHGSAYAVARNPWNPSGLGTIAATRLSQVRNPSRVVLFAPTAKASFLPDEVYQDPVVGYCEVRPPYLELDPGGVWIDPQWAVGELGMVETTEGGAYGAGAGLPIARSGGDLLPVVHLDGSATVEQIGTLSRDMRHWDPTEITMRRTAAP